MQNFINEIVEELIAVDKTLANQREELTQLVKKLLKNKPDVKLDGVFRSQLKQQIFMRLEEIKTKPTPKFNSFFMQKSLFAIAGFAAALLIVLPLWKPWEIYQTFDNTLTIEEVGGEAFNLLSTANSRMITSTADGINTEMNEAEIPQMLEGEITTFTPPPEAAGRGGGGGVATADYYDGGDYETTAYKYVYNGGLDLPLSDVEVLKRIKNSENAGNLAKDLAKFDFGMVNLSNLPNLEVANFNLAEDNDSGYSVYVDFYEGNISIYNRLPDVYRDCDSDSIATNSDCYESLRLKQSDMLSDAEAIRIADAFVRDLDINLSHYGNPFANQTWKEEYANYPDKPNFYFPENVSVVYPLVIRGEEVYNTSGYPEGLSVNVSVRQKVASGVYGLNTQNYQASNYPAANDLAQIQRFITKGGMYGYLPMDATKTVEIQLGNPENVLMRYYDYNGGESNELIIPALYFPIKNYPAEGMYYQKGITIPLVKSILDGLERGNEGYIQPVIEREIVKVETLEGEANEIANPASTKCEEDGYTLEIRKNDDGSEYGFCMNAEGEGCDEWEYFRGECEIPPVG